MIHAPPTPKLCLTRFVNVAARYGNASTLMKNLNVPVCWMPSRKRTLMDAPGAIGVASVTVPAESDELKAPPLGCDGGCSSVVP